MYFVSKDSIVRKIWGTADTVLFIFAGAAAEFALNKAVDWLYFTGRLPADPLGRLFSTVEYARKIVFSELDEANSSIDKIASIHKAVESERKSQIPDWAYRDVLYMLIDYSIRSFELLQRKMTYEEKQETFDVFYRVGLRMGLKDLPSNYKDWCNDRDLHLHNDLLRSHFTDDLFLQYRKHLGTFRYLILVEGQKLVTPEHVRKLLGFKRTSLMSLIIPTYKILNAVKIGSVLRDAILPKKYLQQVRNLDIR